MLVIIQGDPQNLDTHFLKKLRNFLKNSRNLIFSIYVLQSILHHKKRFTGIENYVYYNFKTIKHRRCKIASDTIHDR